MPLELQLDKDGLVPAIAQDAETGQVPHAGIRLAGLTAAHPGGRHREFYSRSREDLWHKGEVSGNFLHVQSIAADCDGDTLLLAVKPDGPACHTGNTSCFFTVVEELPESFRRQDRGSGILEDLFAVVRERQKEMPEGSYTASLLGAGPARVAQKVVEEAGETAIAAAQGQSEELAGEVADLFYHTLVLLAASGLTPEKVWAELRRRRQGE